MSSATIRLERSGPAIRAALAAHAPMDLQQFEAEFRRAIRQAGDHFDLAPLEAVVNHWWGIAAIRTNPLSEQERQLVAAVRSGDFSGWHTREQDLPDQPLCRDTPPGGYRSPSSSTTTCRPTARAQVDQRIEQLLDSPQGPPEAYDADTDQWVTIYGSGTGLILYATDPRKGGC